MPLDGSAATQTVEVAFVGSRVKQSMIGAVELTAPWLAGPKVEQTSWTVFAPSAAGVGELADADALLLPIETAAAASSHGRFGCGREDHWEIAGSAPTVHVRYREDRPLTTFQRWLWALALATVGVAVGLGRGPFAVREQASQIAWDGRTLVALAVALAAWIWIRPGWVGMVLAGAAIVAWAILRSSRAGPKDV